MLFIRLSSQVIIHTVCFIYPLPFCSPIFINFLFSNSSVGLELSYLTARSMLICNLFLPICCMCIINSVILMQCKRLKFLLISITKNCLLSSLCPRDTERKSNCTDKKLLGRINLKEAVCTGGTWGAYGTLF